MQEKPAEFAQRRGQENDRVLRMADLTTKRFFALDRTTYDGGALPRQTKELLGLAASTVLRCNDCIRYHLEQALAAGVTREAIGEALSVALVVGGSITIPHVRFAYTILDTMGGGSGSQSLRPPERYGAEEA